MRTAGGEDVMARVIVPRQSAPDMGGRARVGRRAQFTRGVDKARRAAPCGGSGCGAASRRASHSGEHRRVPRRLSKAALRQTSERLGE
ncbi:hypothetical protein SKAU_G00033950 [Synaphobranchus kaupii]|uniref:Uncharacterized protein n=1 Tax=Synaphobranchus kaupii TaxID=118154 RepID=A0A9Q1JGB7_SYNKA|nr:hypothetical protein SKAU_G00033950 [Synaphobranchus kaupii]